MDKDYPTDTWKVVGGRRLVVSEACRCHRCSAGFGQHYRPCEQVHPTKALTKATRAWVDGRVETRYYIDSVAKVKRELGPTWHVQAF